VLIADDDAGTRHAWGRFLSHTGLSVMEAEDGDEAVSHALAHEPDVIVMDLALPNLSGLEATKRLKGDPRTSRIPIIAVTGVTFGASAAAEAGCNGYLIKPVDPESLLREIGRVLRRASR
jgi:CheY-like chemotaxis protein